MIGKKKTPGEKTIIWISRSSVLISHLLRLEKSHCGDWRVAYVPSTFLLGELRKVGHFLFSQMGATNGAHNCQIFFGQIFTHVLQSFALHNFCE